MNNQIVISPLEQFEVSPVIGISNLFTKGSLTVTNLGLYVIFVLIVFIGLGLLTAHPVTNDNKSNGVAISPSRWSIGFESAYTSLMAQTKEQVGTHAESYFPFIYSLFFFILASNLFGNIPYSFAITSSVIVAIGFSVIIYLGVTILAVYKHGLHFLSFFVPAGTPGPLVPLLILIEIISNVARAFSLGIRLFANIVAGHALLNILAGMLYKIISIGILSSIISLIPLIIFIALVGLEIAVSVIQAYVFTVLTITYIHDAEYLH